MNLKVLKVDSMFNILKWICDDNIEDIKHELKKMNYIEISPIFNRDGYYLFGGKCWHEWNGLAWQGNVNDFKFNLNQLNVKPFSKAEIEAIKILKIYRSCPKNILNQLCDYDIWNNHIKLKRESRCKNIK